MKIFLALIILFILSFNGYGQVDSVMKKNGSAWLIKWAPSSLMTPETPTMQVGMEFIPKSNHFSFSADYGVKCIIGKNEWDNRFDRQYTKSRVELRYYLHPFKEEKHANYFFSVEGFRIDYRYSKQDSWYYAYDGNIYTYDFARISKNIEGIVLKAGTLLKLKPNLKIEIYFGPGIRDVNVTFSDLVNKKGSKPFLFDFDPQYERHSLKPHLAAGCKISYQLNKNKK